MKQKLSDLLITTKDGDWGDSKPKKGYLPYYVIRGADFPLVRIGDVSSVTICYLDEKTVNRRTLQPDDIIIETAGGNRGRPTGRTLLITEKILEQFDRPSTCASFSRFLRVNPKKADPKYLFWYLQFLYSRGEMWEYQVQHTGVARFQYTVFANTIEIPLPPFPTQHAIARILDSLDDKIELNRQMNETLEAMARAIFQSWFVAFDPVRAKAEGRDTGLPPEVAALFPDEIVEVDGREVPKGWGVKPLSDSIDVKMGQSPSGATYNENGEGIPFFQGRADFGFRYPSVRVYCTAPTRFAEAGDSLVSVRAPVGDINLAPEKCCIGRGVAAVLHKTGSRSFTYYQMLSFKQVFALFESEGTVFGSIGKTDFNSIECITPSDEIVKKFEEIVFPLDQMIENNEQQSRTLAQIRDALLPKLMSGEIRIDTNFEPSSV
jgi:type I restriction enzyme S subunit